MEKTKIILMLLLLFGASTLYAQGKKNAKSDKKDNVVIVDDEACGCELVFIDGIQTIQRGDLFGFKREDGTIIVEPKYKFVDKFHDNYCLVYKDYNLCGLIDRDGREIVPPEYEEVNYPTDGMIRVRKNERDGFVDTTGALAIECQYRTASGFSEGLAVALIDMCLDTVTDHVDGATLAHLDDAFGGSAHQKVGNGKGCKDDCQAHDADDNPFNFLSHNFLIY